MVHSAHCTELVPAGSLRRAVGSGGYFALAFGAIIGSGWVVVLGDWLKAAGPGGALIGFGLGAAAMMLIACCYGELAARFPWAGAEFLYVLETFGPNVGFIIAWYLTLYAIAVCAFEGIALGWIMRTLWPPIDIGIAYTILGATVSWGSIATGALGTLLVGCMHYAGTVTAIRFQNLVTYGFILISGVLIAIALTLGHRENLRPMFPSGVPAHPLINGVLWVFATCAFFLNGWQTALHAIEERRVKTSPGGAVISMIAGIAVAAIFYAAIVIAAAMSVPWQRLPREDLPAVAGFRSLTAGGLLGTILLVAAAVSLAKTWNAMAWVGSRLLFAQARHKLLPLSLLDVDRESGAPRVAIIVVMITTLVGILAGRGAIVPIVDMVSTCVALSFVLCLIVLLKARRTRPGATDFMVRGGTATVVLALLGAGTMVGIALGRPFLDQPHKLPPEWTTLLVWGAIGICVRWVSIIASPARRGTARAPP